MKKDRRSVIVGILRRGLKAGLMTTWDLGKIIFPITLVMTLLRYTPVLEWIVTLIAPVMKWIGLSGDAAIPLVLGNFLNLYAGIGAILTLDLTVKEVFILAVMLSFSHNLLIESGVAARVGVKLWVILAVRLGLAVLSAFVINIVWQGGSEQAAYGFVSQTNEMVTGWGSIILQGLEKASLGVLQLALIVIPLMIFIQLMKDLSWLSTFSRWMAPVTKGLGMKENTSTTLAAGLVFGLAYGAGVMIQAVKEDGVEKKDLYLAFIFLVACHAVIEDTLIFIPLGIPVIWLLLVRLVTAILLTIIVSVIWKRRELNASERKEPSYEH
ncbi:nucleoside recognition domain-containing protein [Guptibacillus hwajinpoensis]|uniref:nucleoside recognition domain-containing protein n=1 Tax=Guptibacillus hwajinpoensis TaxID=208199 RepID=UPI001CFE07FE|nr:nucleoside recognition domain-containing protein [Pseudalkalibacillus hwajinpoensis]WLR61270.1 nucleoside recognition domain-containing protein [Pseudalkalibacillus hwajinpoensis]